MEFCSKILTEWFHTFFTPRSTSISVQAKGRLLAKAGSLDWLSVGMGSKPSSSCAWPARPGIPTPSTSLYREMGQNFGMGLTRLATLGMLKFSCPRLFFEQQAQAILFSSSLQWYGMGTAENTNSVSWACRTSCAVFRGWCSSFQKVHLGESKREGSFKGYHCPVKPLEVVWASQAPVRLWMMVTWATWKKGRVCMYILICLILNQTYQYIKVSIVYSDSWGGVPGRGLSPGPFKWNWQGLNLGPFECRTDALPLNHSPSPYTPDVRIKMY